MMRENSPAGTLRVPLNIMCSSTCATPVVPLASSMLPTLYHTIRTATGARRSVLTKIVQPLGNVLSASGVPAAARAWDDAVRLTLQHKASATSARNAEERSGIAEEGRVRLE